MPSLSLTQQISQIIFWQTPASLTCRPPDWNTIGGIYWHGGRAAEALLLTADWQEGRALPLLFLATPSALPQGGTDFPPFLCLDYQPSLEPTAQLARWITHEAHTMGIHLLVLPPANAWSRDPERAEAMMHLWQQSAPEVVLAQDVLLCGDPLSPEALAQALHNGIKALVTPAPAQVADSLATALAQGLIPAEHLSALAQFWLTLKKKRFPQSGSLADLPGDAIPSLQNLLGDHPLPSPWVKVSIPQHPWQQWRSPEALALAQDLALSAMETTAPPDPPPPDFTWIWTATLPTLATPALSLAISLGIPYLISHPWRDPSDITALTGSRILVQWFGEMTPPPLFWHWLAEHADRLWGVIAYGHLTDHPDLLTCCQTHAIPYARTLSAAAAVQTQILQAWLPAASF